MSEVGRIVAGKYRVLRTIGVGGMGTVYEGVHIVTERRVAVKVMHAQRIQGSANATRRFLKEARAAASIGHPGIVDVLDAGQELDGSLYLVLELLEGFDLENALIRKVITPMEAVRICKEVCGPLAAAHARGMIHRDIKPPNIFIAGARERRSVKLLDFGIVKQRDEQITMHGSLVGTIEYMSPEQAIGAGVDPRCDVWGLGATMFFCLAGRPPFQAPVPLDVLKMIAEQDAPKLRGVAPAVPAELAEVVDKCLSRDREERWPSVLALQAALSRCLESSPPKPVSARVVAAIALGVAAVGVACTIALMPRAEAPKRAAPIEIPAVHAGQAIEAVEEVEAIDDVPEPELVAPRPLPAKKVARRPKPPPRRPGDPIRGYR